MSASNAVKKAFSRLPTTVRPIAYQIRLKPDLKAFTFKGWIKVQLDVVVPTDTIVCNAAELEVASVRLRSLEADPVPKESIKLCSDAETLTVSLAEKLPTGKLDLFCTYQGTLNDQMVGFYRSKYPAADGSGEERYCATTQFEATEARRCFPCWDEPALKATFCVSVIAPKDRTVLSNMPVVESSEKGDLDRMSKGEVAEGLKLVRFDQSPIMSSYLVAVIVGEFEAVRGQSKEGVQLSCNTPVGKTEQGQFALDTSIKALEFFTNFFGVKYPLPKYDSIGLADFQCGAMENWGLVTYRESCLLVDPKNTSKSSKQWVSIVVCHEMAHMWFGNLVTMEWWTHLWLKEGFASFCENRCTDALYPEFAIWPQFVADSLIPALEGDALENSHPIEVEVGHPSEVNEIFDTISYQKGASVIRMLHDYIGNDAFRQGLKSYLTVHAYKNAETGDLWKCLAEASGKPVNDVMSTWTSQMGFPLVVVESVAQDGDVTRLKLRQEKFTADGTKPSENFMWQIPIKILTGEGKCHSVLMTGETMEVAVEGNPEGSWVKLNDDFVGYYRVQYPSEYISSFLPDIAAKKMGELNRLSLLDDLMACVENGKVSADVALKMITAFKEDESYIVWRCINNFLSKLRLLVADDPEVYKMLNDFILGLMDHIVESVGWVAKDDEHHTRALLRTVVLSRMGQLGHEKTVAEAKRRFADHLDGSADIPADLRSVVYRTVVAHGGETAFNQLVDLHNKNDLHEEKDRIARSLGAAKERAVLEKVLAFSISEHVRSQDTPFVIISASVNTRGRNMAWEFYKKNFDLFFDRYKEGMLHCRLVKRVTESFVTLDMATEIEAFFASVKNPAERSVKQSLETIRLQDAWLRRDMDKIKAFLSSAN